MPDHKYRFQLDQFVRVIGPIVSVCKKDSYECPNRNTCTEDCHEICRVEAGPLFNLFEELEMDITPKITVDGQQWPILYDLRIEGYGWTPVFTTNINQVKSALKQALEEDLDYNVADDTIFDRVGEYWRFGRADLISKQVGELTVEQIFDFYVSPETGELDFGSLTTIKDIATNCAEKLAARASQAPGIDPPAAGVAQLRISSTTG